MPTRKQRRRREKGFRHEFETVLLDEDGNEVPFDADEARRERVEREATRGREKPKAKQGAAQSRGGRPARDVKPPSWERAFKRGGIWGSLLFVVFVFFFKSSPLGTRIAWGVVYAIAFIPLTYLIDRMAYRAHLRRTGQGGDRGQRSPR